MSREILATRRAKLDLARIRRWYLQPGAGRRARKRLEHIKAAISDLAQAPSRWPHEQGLNVRARPVEGHRIVYSVRPDTGDDQTAGDVTVLRVFGPGQDRSAL